MTHDPLCLASRSSVVCLHCAGENDNRGKSNYCSDCWDHYVVFDLTEPVPECQCDLIAKVVKREQEKAAERIAAIEPMGEPFDGGYHDGYRDALDHAEQAVAA